MPLGSPERDASSRTVRPDTSRNAASRLAKRCARSRAAMDGGPARTQSGLVSGASTMPTAECGKVHAWNSRRLRGIPRKTHLPTADCTVGTIDKGRCTGSANAFPVSCGRDRRRTRRWRT